MYILLISQISFFMKPKTIITYLLTGDPQGIKILSLTGWIGKALVVPRSELKKVKDRPEMAWPSIYFLFWEDDNGGEKVYIGETTNLFQRLTSHDTTKNFWDRVIAFVSNDESLSSTEIKYLESRCIEMASEAKRYQLENHKEQIPKNLPEWKVAEMDDFLENIDLLISAGGFPVLQKIIQKQNWSAHHKYECSGPNSNAKWIYQSDGFLVLKWSRARIQLTNSTPSRIPLLQELLLREWIIIKDSDVSFIFKQDWVFNSPTTAAAFILWRSVNGWNVWKNETGTLNENERREIK